MPYKAYGRSSCSQIWIFYIDFLPNFAKVEKKIFNTINAIKLLSCYFLCLNFYERTINALTENRNTCLNLYSSLESHTAKGILSPNIFECSHISRYYFRINELAKKRNDIQECWISDRIDYMDISMENSMHQMSHLNVNV